MPALPKDPKIRQRRNRSSTAAGLKKPDPKSVRVPPLPTGREWNEMTAEWWDDIWHSPMAGEYDPSDIHGLYILAQLVDEFWTEPAKELAAEIRLQRQCFGLSPIDRRRLQWEIGRVESVVAKREPAEPKRGRKDPRLVLVSSK